MANSNLNTQGSPPGGAYIQPATGIVIQATVDCDVNGNIQQSVAGPNTGLAYFGVAAYRDAQITVQNGSKASAPSAGGTIVTMTPGTAGLWEVIAQVAVTGTTVAAADSNNFALNVGTTATISPITYPVQSTTGAGASTVPPVVVNLGTASVLLVTAVGNSTSGSIYSATLVARRVG